MRYDPYLYETTAGATTKYGNVHYIQCLYYSFDYICCVFVRVYMIYLVFYFFVDILFCELGTGCEILKTESSSADMTIVIRILLL